MLANTIAELVSAGRIAPDWGAALAAADADAVATAAAKAGAAADTRGLEAALAELRDFLSAEAEAGAQVLPDAAHVFRAFERPLADVRVLIVGQDPYPTPGHAIGLSFATSAHVRPLPRSLANIYTELDADFAALAHETAPESAVSGNLGDAGDAGGSGELWAGDGFWASPVPPRTGDLSAWADAGVLLLNRVLTVRAGEAGSHRGRGWETVTELAIRALVDRGGPLVAILWGNDARALAPLLGDTPRIESAHPSPLSARRGFFGSRPFTRANALLAAQGATPIDWRGLGN